MTAGVSRAVPPDCAWALAVEIVDRELARLGDVQAALDLSLDVLREAAQVRDSTMSVLEDRMVLDFKIK